MKRTNSQTIHDEDSPVKTPKNKPKRAKVFIESSPEDSVNDDDDSGDEDYEMKAVESSDESEVDENASDDCEVTYDSTPQSTPKSSKKTTVCLEDALNVSELEFFRRKLLPVLRKLGTPREQQELQEA